MDEITKTQKGPIAKIDPIDDETKKPGFSFKELMEMDEPSEEAVFSDECALEEEEDDHDALAIDGPVNPFFRSPFIPAISSVKESSPPPASIQEVSTALIDPIKVASKGGITQTKVILQTKMLPHLTVTIDHYDTAPHSFNIFLEADPHLSDFLAKHQKSLEILLRTNLPSFECHLYTKAPLRPVHFSSQKKSKNSLVKSEELSYSADKDEKDL